MHNSLLFLLALLLSTCVHGVTQVPLSASKINNLGFVSDPQITTGLFHDGGGGATQNGYHVQTFADSGNNAHGLDIVHNSIAYFGMSDSSNPLDEFTFGLSGKTGSKVFTAPFVGAENNETALGSNFAIWALSGMTAMPDGEKILGVFPCLNEGTGEGLYSTMVQIEIVDPNTVAAGKFPPTTRLGNGRLFYDNEVQYGTFGISADIDGYLYLMGSDLTGVKLARTPNTPTSIADRNQYTYWNNQTGTWQKNPLIQGNAVGNILNWSVEILGKTVGPYTAGDIWYDPYHETTMMLFMDTFVDGRFWVSYATTNDLTGPWSEPVSILSYPTPDKCNETSTDWNYAGHAHPGWDPTGKTLLVSYSSCAIYVSMALITWA